VLLVCLVLFGTFADSAVTGMAFIFHILVDLLTRKVDTLTTACVELLAASVSHKYGLKLKLDLVLLEVTVMFLAWVP
jgi:hypothetical protein